MASDPKPLPRPAKEVGNWKNAIWYGGGGGGGGGGRMAELPV